MPSRAIDGGCSISKMVSETPGAGVRVCSEHRWCPPRVQPTRAAQAARVGCAGAQVRHTLICARYKPAAAVAALPSLMVTSATHGSGGNSLMLAKSRTGQIAAAVRAPSTAARSRGASAAAGAGRARRACPCMPAAHAGIDVQGAFQKLISPAYAAGGPVLPRSKPAEIGSQCRQERAQGPPTKGPCLCGGVQHM